MMSLMQNVLLHLKEMYYPHTNYSNGKLLNDNFDLLLIKPTDQIELYQLFLKNNAKQIQK